jgi:hypothetical protein
MQSFTYAPPTHTYARARNTFAHRLRLRLVKLGCISLDNGLLEGKTLSVIKLLKPYKLKVGFGGVVGAEQPGTIS